MTHRHVHHTPNPTSANDRRTRSPLDFRRRQTGTPGVGRSGRRDPDSPSSLMVLVPVVAAALLLAAWPAGVAAQPEIPPLGPPPTPPGNPITPEKVNLGKALFWDEQLSSTKTVSCGTCHQAPTGGSDPRSVIGSMAATAPGPDGIRGTADDVVGSPGVMQHSGAGEFVWEDSFGIDVQVTGRKTNSFLNAGYPQELFWDGRAGEALVDPLTDTTIIPNGAALETQVLGPPVSSTEMGHLGRDWATIATEIAAATPLALSPSIPTDLENWIDGRGYPALFAEVFGDDEVTPVRIAMAIATYERILWTGETPFDEFNRGIMNALTPQERSGLNLFRTRGCGVCHAGALTSDNQFHYIGVRPVTDDLGRFEVTGAPPDRGRFKTPSLRNVALRAPYMHNGGFASLAEVIDFYNRGGDFDAPNKAPGIVPLNLTEQEQADLEAFLRGALTDPRVEAGTAPFDRPLLYSESDQVPDCEPVGGDLALSVPGSGGHTPVVHAIEPPVFGNTSFSIGVDGGLGGAAAVLVVDDNDPGLADGGVIPASGSFAREAATLTDWTGGSSPAGSGYATAVLSIPTDDPSLNGKTVYGRWYVTDAGAANGVAVSRAFSFTFIGTAEGGIAVSGIMIH